MSTRRGFVHEDDERIVQVVSLRRGMYGIALKHKSAEGQVVRFAISKKGSHLLIKFLADVMRGKGKRIVDRLAPTGASVKMMWTQVPPEQP